MAKVKVKKKRINWKKVILAILLLYVIVYLFYSALNSPIRNIYVKGNTILSDQEIIELVGLQNYPSNLSQTSLGMEKKLEKNPFIKEATVKKKIFNQVWISITEHKILCYQNGTQELLFEDGTKLKVEKNQYNVPNLINAIPDEYQKLFVQKMANLTDEVIRKISEIEYKPNDIDKERFLFSMNDGNYVYITLKKIKKLNDYDKIIPYTEGNKGVFYLDSGDYFKILE